MLPRTVRLGDVEVVRIGLGTNRLSHTTVNVGFIRDATSAGIQLIDTAHLYVGGESERTIGAAEAPTLPGVIVATKGGYRSGEGSAAVLRAQIEQSLSSLVTGTIELYYLHRVDPHTALEESLRVIADHRDAGRIRNVGLSQVTVEQIERARRIVPIAAVQSQYNVRDRGWDEVVDYCTREQIVFVPYYPLRGGHAALASIAARHGATEAQIALAWLLHRSPMTLPIPGTLSVEHVRQNLAALDVELSEQDLATLAQVGSAG